MCLCGLHCTQHENFDAFFMFIRTPNSRPLNMIGELMICKTFSFFFFKM